MEPSAPKNAYVCIYNTNQRFQVEISFCKLTEMKMHFTHLLKKLIINKKNGFQSTDKVEKKLELMMRIISY